MPDRLEILKQFVTQKPGDPFPHYGLALEYKQRGETALALETFATLVAQHPAYVPTYLMYGGVLAKAGKAAEAGEILRQGMARAKEQGNQHAYNELTQALAELSQTE